MLYASVSWLVREFIVASEQASSVWLPSGLVLFALLTTPTRHWPAVALTVIAAGTLARFATPGPLSFLIPACEALEGLVGAALLRRFVGSRLDLHRVRDVVGLVMLAAGFSAVLTAFIAVTLIVLLGKTPWQDYWHTWRVFWIGDATGMLVVTPLLLTWAHGVKDWPRRRHWELGAFLLLMGLATHVVFHGEPSAPWTFHPLVYLAFPFIFWAALRFEMAGSIYATVVLSAVALWHTAHGTGPFAETDSQERPPIASTTTRPLSSPGLFAPLEEQKNRHSLFLLQSFLGAVNLCGLLLAAALGERRRAQLEVSILNWELHQSLERLARTQSELVARERLAALGELSATLAHEVRNPLGAISNCVSALRRLPKQRLEVHEQPLLDIISEEVQRLERLVRELLDFARPVHPQPRPEPLEAVVEGALSAVLRSQAAHASVTVRREVEP